MDLKDAHRICFLLTSASGGERGRGRENDKGRKAERGWDVTQDGDVASPSLFNLSILHALTTHRLPSPPSKKKKSLRRSMSGNSSHTPHVMMPCTQTSFSPQPLTSPPSLPQRVPVYAGSVAFWKITWPSARPPIFAPGFMTP